MTERQGNTSFVREREKKERKASGEKEKNKGSTPKRNARWMNAVPKQFQ
jgi:hypothetical protein